MIKPVSLNSITSLPKNIYSGVENLGSSALGAAKKGGEFLKGTSAFKQVAKRKNFAAGAGIIAIGAASLAAITKGVVNKVKDLKEEKIYY